MAAYPDGHPAFSETAVLAGLRTKAGLADYMVTQMCFDADALEQWLAHTRRLGISLPAYIGVPGQVDRKWLLEISMRVGVGTSISFLREQRSATALFRRSDDTAQRLLDATSHLADGGLAVVGAHFFTLNRLIETEQFARLYGDTRRFESTDARQDDASRLTRGRGNPA